MDCKNLFCYLMNKYTLKEINEILNNCCFLNVSQQGVCYCSKTDVQAEIFKIRCKGKSTLCLNRGLQK